jgi:predicted RNA-binding Zn ribbon-like protein
MMKAIVKGPPSAAVLAFRFVSGDRALDFLATFADRYRGGVERLCEPADLDRWFAAAGLATSCPATGSDLEDARRLREAFNRLARQAMALRLADAADTMILNEWARQCPLTPELDERFQHRWSAPAAAAGALAIVAREAVALLGSSDRELLRECGAAPACSLLYLDRSRGRRRRWCEMQRCGSRVKMAGHRARTKP